MSRPAAGGGRWVAVAPERLERWLDGFAARHGATRWSAEPAGPQAQRIDVVAADGSEAHCTVPFPPLQVDAGQPYGGLLAHAGMQRTVGLLLVRLGGFAAGAFEGGQLHASKVGSRPVHGRTAAGGWSQQRFARRREGQAHVALQAAADTACRILLPALDRLDAVATGGDRHAVDAVLADPRLAPLRDRITPELLDVATPDRRVLLAAHEQLRAVRIRVVDPTS